MAQQLLYVIGNTYFRISKISRKEKKKDVRRNAINVEQHYTYEVKTAVEKENNNKNTIPSYYFSAY